MPKWFYQSRWNLANDLRQGRCERTVYRPDGDYHHLIRFNPSTLKLVLFIFTFWVRLERIGQMSNSKEGIFNHKGCPICHHDNSNVAITFNVVCRVSYYLNLIDTYRHRYIFEFPYSGIRSWKLLRFNEKICLLLSYLTEIDGVHILCSLSCQDEDYVNEVGWDSTSTPP